MIWLHAGIALYIHCIYAIHVDFECYLGAFDMIVEVVPKGVYEVDCLLTSSWILEVAWEQN